MRKEQYKHNRSYNGRGFVLGDVDAKGGSTIYLEVPEKHELTEALIGYTQGVIRCFALAYGEANCHDKDNYSRKTGREISKSRAVVTEFILKEVEFKVDRIIYKLKSSKYNTITLETKFSSNRVYFV